MLTAKYRGAAKVTTSKCQNSPEGYGTEFEASNESMQPRASGGTWRKSVTVDATTSFNQTPSFACQGVTEENGEQAEAEQQVGSDSDGPPDQTDEEGGVIFILEKASLEAGKVGKTYQLLNCDDHKNFLQKHKRDPANYRPDIVHQALLAILDSPLNKAGRLKALYIKTDKNVLIQVNPHIRIPRTFKRFCGLMVQLLQKLSIRATNGSEKLLRVVKQPITRHLSVGARRVGMSFSAPKVVQLKDYVAASGTKSTTVFVVGAMAHGKIEADYLDDFVAVSEFPLSAACCIGRICNAFELMWGIL